MKPAEWEAGFKATVRTDTLAAIAMARRLVSEPSSSATVDARILGTAVGLCIDLVMAKDAEELFSAYAATGKSTPKHRQILEQRISSLPDACARIERGADLAATERCDRVLCRRTGREDRAKVELVTTDGTLIEQAFAIDNRDDTTAWTPLAFNFSSPHAGQTVRLRLSSASDDADSTSFFFDSLSVTATVCQ